MLFFVGVSPQKGVCPCLWAMKAQKSHSSCCLLPQVFQELPGPPAFASAQPWKSLCAAAARVGTLSQPGASSWVLDSSQPVWKLRSPTKEQNSIAKATPKDLCLLTWWEWPVKLLLVHSFSIKMHVSVQKKELQLVNRN